jgi:MFS transporter, PPP family, 3-phenylpropionic acid transporter
MKEQHPLPYWRLSGFYFFYFAVIGALIPYWGLYLNSLGYTAQEIGFIGAIVMGTKIVAPNFWGWLAIRSGRRLSVVRLGSFLAGLCFLGIFIRQDFAWLALVVACYTFFWNAVQAQFEVITLGHLRQRYHHYSHIRLWGSIGFIATVVGLGWIFDFLPISYLPAFILSFLILIWLSTLTVTERGNGHSGELTEGLREIIARRSVLSFFVVCFLLQVSHGPYYTFYSLHLVENYGYSRTATGLLWGLGVLAEVLIFVLMHRLLVRFDVRTLLLCSLLLTALRWTMIAFFAHSLFLLLIAQLLHAFSFGVAHAAAIEWVRSHFGGNHHGHGQAFYSAVSFGAGGSLGALLSGMLWDQSAVLTFLLAALVALAAFAVCWWGVHPAKPRYVAGTS